MAATLFVFLFLLTSSFACHVCSPAPLSHPKHHPRLPHLRNTSSSHSNPQLSLSPHVTPPTSKLPPVNEPPPTPSAMIPRPMAHPPPKITTPGAPNPSPPLSRSPSPAPAPAPPPRGRCPVDALKLGACVDLLGGLIHVSIGGNPESTCCPLLEGLADLDAAVCLCTTIRARLLDANLVLPTALSLLVDCGKNPPSGYQCPAAT